MVASITAEELEKQVLPAAMRFSKRQPGAVAQSLPRLAAQVSVDLAPHAKGILDPFAIELLKTQDRRLRGELSWLRRWRVSDMACHHIEQRKRDININPLAGDPPVGGGLLAGCSGVKDLCAVLGTLGT